MSFNSACCSTAISIDSLIASSLFSLWYNNFFRLHKIYERLFFLCWNEIISHTERFSGEETFGAYARWCIDAGDKLSNCCTSGGGQMLGSSRDLVRRATPTPGKLHSHKRDYSFWGAVSIKRRTRTSGVPFSRHSSSPSCGLNWPWICKGMGLLCSNPLYMPGKLATVRFIVTSSVRDVRLSLRARYTVWYALRSHVELPGYACVTASMINSASNAVADLNP